ncbi:MAG: LPS export ABC transporter periplasmic protein LptC [Bacteroidia bacterium]
MFNYQKASILLHKVIYLLLLFFTLASCEPDIQKVRLIADKEKFPLESGDNVELLYSDSARVKVKLTAGRMERYVGDEPYIEMPKGVVVLFYSDSLTVKSSLTANYAVRYENRNIMEAKNDVVVVNEKGDILNTEHLIWDEKQAKIYSDEFVKITTKNEIIYGNGFEANEDFTKYKIFNIKGTINLKTDA